jgi:FixJ family two-component response regulator
VAFLLSQNPVIAIVDDDPAVRESLRALLRSIGYVTHIYASAEELLASSTLKTIDCIISDVRMPGMSGVELHARLKVEGWLLPFILTSAFSEEGLEARALAAGVYAFLKKPFRQEILVRHLRFALGQ